jgi:hypothetical protein
MGGSSKSQTVGYNYSMGAHLILCRGPIDKITCITTQNKIAWSGSQNGSGRITIDKPDLFGGGTSQGGIVGDLDFEVGSPTQGQNDYLASKLGSAYLPSFRGVVGIILRKMNLGMNPYIQPFVWRLSRIHVRQSEGIAQWYDAKAEIAAPSINGIWSYKVIDPYIDKKSYQDPYYIEDGTWTAGLAQSSVPFKSSNSSIGVGDWGLICGNYPDFHATNIWYRVHFAILIAQDIMINISDAYMSGSIWINGNSLSVVDGKVYIPASMLIAGQNVLAMKFGAGVIGSPIHYLYYDNSITFTPTDLDTAVQNYLSYLILHGADHPYVMYYLAYYQNPQLPIGTGVEPWDGYLIHYGSGYEKEQGLYSVTIPEVPNTYNSITFAFASSKSGDMNAAHIIRECLTDPDWGKGATDAQIDDASFTTAADLLYSEGMGLSLKWEEQSEIDAFIQIVLSHINAALYIDRSTGLWTLKLIRKDYDVSTLITLNPSNIASISDYSRSAFGELINSVTVTYFDGVTRQDATLTVQDIALASMQGATISTSVDYKGFCNANIASKVAQRDLQTLSTPLRKCTIVANLSASTLNQGSIFKLTWPDYGMADVVMRVADISFGDGRDNSIQISCVEDVFALPTTQFIQPDEPVWTNPTQPPTPLSERLIFEPPYLELVQISGQTSVDATLSAHPEIGYVAAAGARPTSGNKAQMWDDLGAGYNLVGSLDFCPSATLNQNISYMDATFAINNGSDLSEVTLGVWFQIDQEIMVITAISDTSITVKRGCLDTIPAAHALGATLFFWDNYAQGDDSQLVIGNTPKVKILSVNSGGVLAIANAPEDQITIVGRAAKPYNVANVKINGSYYPTAVHGVDPLTLTWANRNRLSQTGGTIYGFTDANITPESGVTYNINLKDNTGAVFSSATAVTGSVWSATLIDDTHANITVEITALRAGLPSFQSYEIPVERHGWGLNFDNNWDGQ